MTTNYNKVSNITINFIANHILIIMFLSIVILSIVIFITKHDLKFLIAPSIAFFVPFLIIKFNKHKEEKQNEDFNKIIDESIYLNAIKIKENLIKYTNGEYFKLESLEEFKLVEWDIESLKDPEFREYNLEYIDGIIIIYKLLCAELDIIQDSKLQFYDRKTFIKFRDYKLLLDKYKKYIDKFCFTTSFYFLYELNKLLDNEKQKILKNYDINKVTSNENG